MIERRRHPDRPPADIDHGPRTVRLEHLGGVTVANGVPPIKLRDPWQQEHNRRNRERAA